MQLAENSNDILFEPDECVMHTGSDRFRMKKLQWEVVTIGSKKKKVFNAI